MLYRSVGYVDDNDIRSWIEFRADNKLKFYKFIACFNEAVATLCGTSEDDLNDEVLDILENISENFNDIRYYLDTLSYEILSRLPIVERRNLAILNYVRTFDLAEVDYNVSRIHKAFSPTFDSVLKS